MSKIVAQVPVSEQKDFEICPKGTYLARIYQVIDLGTQETEYKGVESLNRKFKIDFELPTKKAIFNPEKGEQPFPLSDIINYRITISDSTNKAKLNSIIEACGMEAKKGFNIFDLLGKTCMISVDHYTANNGKTYANISNYSGVADLIDVNDKKFAPINKQIEFYLDPEYFDGKIFNNLPKWVKEKIEVTNEYKLCTGELPTGLSVDVSKSAKPKKEKEVKEEVEEDDEVEVEGEGIDVDKLGIQMPF